MITDDFTMKEHAYLRKVHYYELFQEAFGMTRVAVYKRLKKRALQPTLQGFSLLLTELMDRR